MALYPPEFRHDCVEDSLRHAFALRNPADIGRIESKLFGDTGIKAVVQTMFPKEIVRLIFACVFVWHGR